MDAVTIADREERVVAIDARLADIDTEYNNTLMPTDVREEWNQLNSERDQHVATINEVKARKNRMVEIVNNQPQATERPRTQTPAFVQRRSDEQIYDVIRHRAESNSEEDLKQRLHDNAKRAIEKATFSSVRNQVTREDAQTRVERLLNDVDDDKGTLAQRILATGEPAYEKWFWAQVKNPSLRQQLPMPRNAGMALGTDTDGGFAVPFQLDPTVILTSDGSINPLRQVSRVEQIVGKEWQGITSTGIVVTRSAENAEASDNSFDLAEPTVRAKRVLAFVPFSMEIDQDWGSMRSEITRLIQDAKDQEEATSFVLGDGTGNNPNGLVTTLATGSRVTQSGAAGSLTVPADLYKLEEALGPRFRARASFLANKSIYNKIRAAALAAGLTAEDVWVRLSSGQPPELIGYAARELSSMDNTLSLGAGVTNLVLLFGDYQTGFLIVDRIGMNVETVPHLFGATNRFPTGQRGIVAIWRNNSKILADNAIRVLNSAGA